MSNEKRAPGCLGYLLGMKSYPAKCPDYFINHDIRIPINQPGFHGFRNRFLPTSRQPWPWFHPWRWPHEMSPDWSGVKCDSWHTLLPHTFGTQLCVGESRYMYMCYLILKYIHILDYVNLMIRLSIFCLHKFKYIHQHP